MLLWKASVTKFYEAEKSYCYFTEELSFRDALGMYCISLSCTHAPTYCHCRAGTHWLHPPHLLQETSGTVPGQTGQLRRPAVTPLLAATWLTPSTPGICTEVSEGLWPQLPTPPWKPPGFTVTCRAVRCGGWGEDNPRSTADSCRRNRSDWRQPPESFPLRSPNISQRHHRGPGGNQR